VLLFGDWAPGEVVTLSHNGNKIKDFSTKNYLDHSDEMCSSSQQTRVTTLDIKLNLNFGEHLSVLTFQTFVDNSKQFGIKDFNLSFVSCPSNSDLTESGCTCRKGYFKELIYPGFQCSKCPIACLECDSKEFCHTCNQAEGFQQSSHGICSLEKGNYLMYLFNS
jgi:hypothetical protein